MFAIIGIVVVFGCVVGGYLMEHGNLRVLIQPAELVTITVVVNFQVEVEHLPPLSAVWPTPCPAWASSPPCWAS
jgi:hypothetical protein